MDACTACLHNIMRLHLVPTVRPGGYSAIHAYNIIRSNVIVPGALLIISTLGPSDSVSLASQ